MEWLKKNQKWIMLILTILFVFKFVQSCNRGMTINTKEKNYTYEIDSITNMYENIIELQELNCNELVDSLVKENITKDYIITDLNAELKVAGVKVNEAQRRADAIQKTAESIKANTTIEVKGVEKNDTTKNNIE